VPTIKFTDTTGRVLEQFNPVPGKQAIPDWLKKLGPYMDKDFNISEDGKSTNQTVKRCVPVLDAVMTGYVIKLTHDIDVSERNGSPYYQWPSGPGVDFHTAKQASTHDAAMSGFPIPKIMNPWSIQTPPGYSTMFIPLLNGEQKALTPFSGVVDTDTYYAPVHFPFMLAKGFEGIIHAGSPIIQAIPFRRESWKMQIASGQTEQIERNQNSITHVFKNAYRGMYWARKDYS
jgi:hypothetical protein